MKRSLLGGSTSQDPRAFLFSTTRAMRVVGVLQNPADEKRKGKAYNYYALLIFILIVLQTLSQIMDLLVRKHNVMTVAENGVFTLLSMNSVFKAFWLWKKRLVMASLLADMNASFRLNPPVAKELNARANKPVNSAYNTFAILTVMAYIYWMSTPFLQYASALYSGKGKEADNRTEEAIYIYNIGYTLPARAWFPVDVFCYPNYYLAYAFQFVSLTYIVFISISVDLAFFVSVMRVNAQLLYLQADLESAGNAAVLAATKKRPLGTTGDVGRPIGLGGLTESEFVFELTRVATDCVRYHTDILRVTRSLNGALGGIALSCTRLYSLVLVVAAMTIVEVHGVDANYIQMLVYSSCFVYMLYLCYSPADDIIESQYKVSDSVVVGLWSPAPYASRDLAYIIIRMMMMSNKPAHLTAGYIRMDRVSYKKEIQSVASMFNALWQMKNADRI